MLWIHLSWQVLLCLVGMQGSFGRYLLQISPTHLGGNVWISLQTEKSLWQEWLCVTIAAVIVTQGRMLSMIEHCRSSRDSGNIGYSLEAHLELKCCENLFAHNLLLRCHIILHRAWRYHGGARCKFSKQFDWGNRYSGWTSFHDSWV